ncbi:MAG: 2-oxoacid:acceptor oxidoreductase family protein, partial [Bacilli bacterium]
RGGTANCSIIIAKNPIYSPVFQQANTVIIMNQPSLERFQSRVINGGCLLYNASLIDPFPLQDGIQGLGVPINQLANELGNLIVANVVMLGAYLEMSRLFTLDEMTSVLIDFLQDGKEKYIDINSQALIKGWNYAKEYKRVKKSI